MKGHTRKLTFDTVREIALALPGVEDGKVYGSPAVKINGKLMACIAINKSAEPNTLALRIDFDQRDALIAEAPERYYLTDHYKDGPIVLVRLSKVDADSLRDLLQASWRFVRAEKSKKR